MEETLNQQFRQVEGEQQVTALINMTKLERETQQLMNKDMLISF